MQDFFSKIPSILLKTQILKVLRFLLFQSLCTANLLQFDLKKFRHVNNRCRLVYTSSIGKNRVKKTYPCERKILLSIFSIWRKINRRSFKFVHCMNYFKIRRKQSFPNNTLACSHWLNFSYSVGIHFWFTRLNSMFLNDVRFHAVNLNSNLLTIQTTANNSNSFNEYLVLNAVRNLGGKNIGL